MLGTRNELCNARWLLDDISDQGILIFEVKHKENYVLKLILNNQNHSSLMQYAISRTLSKL